MLEFLAHNYALLAVGLFFGNTPALIFALYLTLNGYYNVVLVCAVSIATTLLWDSVWYILGVALAHKRLRRFMERPAVAKAIALAGGVYKKHPFKFLFLSRFVYGASSAAAIAGGYYRLSFPFFLLVSGSSIALWFWMLYGVGVALDWNLGLLERVAYGIPLGLPVFLITMFFIYYIGRLLVRRYIYGADTNSPS